MRDEKDANTSIEFERCGDVIFITIIDENNEFYGGVVSIKVSEWDLMTKTMRIEKC
jgi:hypothetical protein